MSIARNHTATHVLLSALQKVLGDHVEQAGSYVGNDRLRFDFNNSQAMTSEEISKVEEMVNDVILLAGIATIGLILFVTIPFFLLRC